MSYRHYIEQRLRNLEKVKANIVSRLLYAEGQAHHHDRAKLRDLKRRIESVKSELYATEGIEEPSRVTSGRALKGSGHPFWTTSRDVQDNTIVSQTASRGDRDTGLLVSSG